jgi:hypothetical protein
MSTSENTERSPWTRPWFLISAVLVAILAIVGIVLAVLPDDANGRPTPTTSPTSTASPSPTAVTDGESKCGLPPGSQAVPAAPPEGATWELFGTFAAPSIENIGPGVGDPDGIRSCFAHSPTGALLAAINYWAMGWSVAGAGADARLVASTPERAALQEQYRQQGTPDPALLTGMQVAGFNIVRYSESDAVVDLAVRTETGAVGSLPTPLRWEDGDWKFVIPPTGNTGLQQLPNLAGYVLWSGI